MRVDNNCKTDTPSRTRVRQRRFQRSAPDDIRLVFEPTNRRFVIVAREPGPSASPWPATVATSQILNPRAVSIALMDDEGVLPEARCTVGMSWQWALEHYLSTMQVTAEDTEAWTQAVLVQADLRDALVAVDEAVRRLVRIGKEAAARSKQCH